MTYVQVRVSKYSNCNKWLILKIWKFDILLWVLKIPKFCRLEFLGTFFGTNWIPFSKLSNLKTQAYKIWNIHKISCSIQTIWYELSGDCLNFESILLDIMNKSCNVKLCKIAKPSQNFMGLCGLRYLKEEEKKENFSISIV